MEFQTTRAWSTEAAAMVVAMVTVTVAAVTELEKSAVTAVPVVRQEDRRRIG